MGQPPVGWQIRENRDRTQGLPAGAWRWFLAGGLLLVGTAAVVLPSTARFGPVVLADMATLAAILFGLWRYRPANSWPWKLLTAGFLVDTLTTVLAWRSGFGTGTAPEVPWYVDSMYLLRYPFYGLALARFSPARSGHSRAVGILDAAIVACGLLALLWTFTIDPLVDAAPTTIRAISLLVGPTLDLVLMIMAIRLFLITKVRTPSVLLLAIGLGMALLAYPLLVSTLLHNSPASRIGYLPWIAESMTIGAAALHPSMSAMLIEQNDDTISRKRLAVFAALAFGAPMIALIRVINTDIHNQIVFDIVFPTVISAILSVLMVVRLGQIAALAQRRRAEVHAQATNLSQSLTEQLALQNQLSFRALHDALTGLPNRALLMERLERALNKQRGTDSHALLILDLDGFKDVNDTFGHPVGDQLLVTVAHRLHGCLSRNDTLARLGGDEFAALLEDIPAEAAHAVANRLVDAVRAPYVIEGHEFFVTASVGVLTTTGIQRTTLDVMRDADLALYAAKASGKNQTAVFSAGLRTAQENRTRLAAALRRALIRKEFTLAYQPVIDLETGSVRALEALIRWTPPGAKPVPPDQFIPVAEEIGLIVEIGDWVIQRACTDARRWHERYGLSVAVNVSGRQLTESDFADKLIRALRSHRLPGSAIVVEITETVIVATTTLEADTVRMHLQRLREFGIRVAIDDFGTGYSSLSYLRNLPVDVLKIDRTFTSFDGEDDASRQHRAFTGAILQLSESLGLETIAEGVETAEQAEVLQQMRCPLAQGFLYARPMPAANIDAILQDRSPSVVR